MDELLLCRGLTRYYGSEPALTGVDLVIRPGRFVGLLGPNGSGKTTLMTLAAGLLTPTAGGVWLAGHAPGPESKGLVSYLPDREHLPGHLPVEELVALYADFYPDFHPDRARAMLRDLDLDPRKPLRRLSKGNREKVQLILTMCRRAALYLLDEPIGGIDPAARDYILHTILSGYDEGSSVLLSTHLIQDVEPILDEAVFLKQGQVLCHRSADELRQTEGKSLDAYFREVYKC